MVKAGLRVRRILNHPEGHKIGVLLYIIPSSQVTLEVPESDRNALLAQKYFMLL